VADVQQRPVALPGIVARRFGFAGSTANRSTSTESGQVLLDQVDDLPVSPGGFDVSMASRSSV